MSAVLCLSQTALPEVNRVGVEGRRVEAGVFLILSFPLIAEDPFPAHPSSLHLCLAICYRSSMPSTEEPHQEPVSVTAGTDDDRKKERAVELSEEDQSLKEGLELAVTRLSEADESLYQQALDHLVSEIRSSTASMTSVPKPLKFLKPHYSALKAVHSSWPDSQPMKRSLADVLSVLAMTMAASGSRECLAYKLAGNSDDISSWGHEYVRSLAGEVSEEYNQRQTGALEEVPCEDLMRLVDIIVPFQISHNAEADAVDLLLEVQQLGKLVACERVDDKNYERVCLYLLRCSDFAADPDDLAAMLTSAYDIYKTHRKFTDAARVALKLDDTTRLEELFSDELGVTRTEKQQMCFILARHRSSFETSSDELNALIGNARLSEQFLAVARDLDVLSPKTPEQIYKSHLSEGSSLSRRGMAGALVDSAKANLAASFVNGFANAGFCADSLMSDDSSQWVFKNKEHGMTSAVASLGLVMLWNIDEGLNKIDKYLMHSDENIKAGGVLAVGIISSGVRNESDPALALLSEYVEGDSVPTAVRHAAISGLGIAYAGQNRPELLEMLVARISNTEVSIAQASLASLSLGMIFAGTCNEEAGTAMVQRLMESSETDLGQSHTRFLCLGLGLLFLGKTERADAMLEVARTVEHKVGRYLEVTLQTCAYAGSGDVLRVQEMLRICAEHLPEPAGYQAVAVLGIALAVVGEDVGTEMALRTFDHLLHYAEIGVRRVVPLAFALLYVSNPEYGVVDQLSRLSHDSDHELAMNAIFGLGLISAGTNNSRVAGLLRQLSDFYSKESNHLFIVRVAQGLNSLGKGLIGLTPFHSDRLLMNGPAMAGLLAVLHSCIDITSTLLEKHHSLLFYLTTAMSPRFMTTVDEELSPVPCSVRVGLAVETVGQAGRPKTITGFQVNSSTTSLLKLS